MAYSTRIIIFVMFLFHGFTAASSSAGFRPHTAGSLSVTLPLSLGAIEASVKCSQLLQPEQVHALSVEKMQDYLSHSENTFVDRALIKLIRRSIENEVQRICAESEGCTGAEVIQLTSERVEQRLATARSWTQRVRYTAGFVILGGAVAVVVRGAGFMRQEVGETHWVSEWFIQPMATMLSGAIMFPLMSYIQNRIQNASSRLMEGSEINILARNADAREAMKVARHHRAYYSKDEVEGVGIIDGALSRLASGSEAAASRWAKGEKEQAANVFAYNMWRLRFQSGSIHYSEPRYRKTVRVFFIDELHATPEIRVEFANLVMQKISALEERILTDDSLRNEYESALAFWFDIQHYN